MFQLRDTASEPRSLVLSIGLAVVVIGIVALDPATPARAGSAHPGRCWTTDATVVPGGATRRRGRLRIGA